MKIRVPVMAALAALGCASVFPLGLTVSRADEAADSLLCLKNAAFFASPNEPDYRKYAPDRLVDIEHLVLDVTPDFTNRTVAGSATYTFKPIAKALPELRLNAVDLAVESVTSSEKILAYQVTDSELVITFAEPVAVGKATRVVVQYHAQPHQGIYFRTPEMGYKTGDTHLFSQGETIEARHWFPCFDAPNEKFTSEVICHVPEGMTVLSNGRQISSEKDAKTGLMTVHWSQEKPHVTYLITLTAGYFKKLEDNYRSIPLSFYTPPSESAEAPNSFGSTKDVLKYFEEEIGVPYAWAKYGQVLVNDFHFGGMENTSMTTLTDRTLFRTDTENLFSSDSLVAHEFAHQWFGDLVTCKDWSHVWLNEGFATYYAHLFMGHKYGHDELLYGLYNDAQGIVRQTTDLRPIVTHIYDKPDDQFGYRAYPKGSWVLHMLRNQLGEDLYRQCIKTYLERHQYGNVVTDDLRAVIEELSGKSYDQFFDQWLYHGAQPELEINYSWDERSKLAKISVKQVQKIGDNVVLFRFPVKIRFKSKAGMQDFPIEVKQSAEDFYCSLPQAPESVRFDPEFTLLAKTTFNLPTPMLLAQLDDSNDVIGRLLAIEQLATKKDHETIARLKKTLNNDSFYGVRAKASEALRQIHSDEALTALLESTKQSDARVRNTVVNDIGGFYNTSAYEALLKVIEGEKNPGILVTAIHGLGAYAKPEVKDLLLRNLNSDSYRNRLAEAAIGAIRSQDNPAYIEPLRDCLKQHEERFTSQGFAAGLDTLAYIARKEEKKDGVREFIAGYVGHKKDRIQLAAINALGTLEDPRAIALLSTFASAAKDTPEQKAAERAITALNAAQKPVDQLGDLRKEVLDLQSDNRRLNKEVEDLKKRLDATAKKPAKK